MSRLLVDFARELGVPMGSLVWGSHIGTPPAFRDVLLAMARSAAREPVPA